jgi:hypothetical protein
MKYIEFLEALPEGIFNENGNLSKTRFLIRGSSVSVLPVNYKKRDGDEVVDFSQINGSATYEVVDLSIYEPEFITAEKWLEHEGFSSIRVITLLDLENKIAAVNKTSPKLTAVRAWINGILATFVQAPTPKNDWPPAPFSFEETTQEAFTVLML